MKFNNKTLLSTAIAALISTSVYAENDVNTDFYGSLRIGIDSVDANSDDDGANGRDYLSRVGIKANQKISDDLTVTGQLEYGMDADFGQKSEPKLRLAQVGLKGDFGSIHYGSQTTLWHKLVRGAYFSDANDSLRQGAIRDDDLIQYYYKTGGLTLAAGTQVEGRDGDDFDQYMLGAEYKTGPLKVQAAYSQDNRGDNNGSLFGARVWYKATDALTLSALTHLADDEYDLYAGNSSGNVKTDTVKAVSTCTTEDRATHAVYAQYKFGQNMIHSRYALNTCDDSGDADSIKIEYVRHITKKFRTWVAFEQISQDDDRVEMPEDGKAKASEKNISAIQIGTRFDF